MKRKEAVNMNTNLWTGLRKTVINGVQELQSTAKKVSWSHVTIDKKVKNIWYQKDAENTFDKNQPSIPDLKKYS